MANAVPRLYMRPAVCLCCLLFSPLSTAVAQYHVDSWTTDNGLPQNSIRVILQTPDGYLWLATADGLVRFDGVRFTTFNRENSPGMTGNRITAIHQDRSGDLWMGSDSSAMRLHHGVFTGYASESGVPNGVVCGIVSDPSGDPLILFSQCVMRWYKGRLERLNTGPFPNSPLGFAVTHYPEPAGFWSQNAEGLEAYLGGRLISWQTRQGNPRFPIRAVAEDEHGTIWAAGTGKLFRDQNGRLAPVPIPSRCSPSEDIGFIPAPKLNVVCYGRNLPLVRSAPDGSEQKILANSPAASLETTETTSPTVFYQDREGILWIGTDGQGLRRVRRQVVVTLSEGQGLRNHNLYPIYQDHSGAIWIGAWPNTLNRYDHGKFHYFTERDGLAPYISALYEDRAGELWVGAYGGDQHDPRKGDGLRVFKDGRFVPPAGLRNLGTVRTILQDQQGALWFGCEDKLVRYQNGAVRSFTTRDGLATNYTIVLVEDHHGNLWIGGQGGLTRLSGNRFTPYTVHDGLPSPTVRALYVDPENVLWIGTYDGGLGRFDKGKFTRYTTRDGLFSDGVFQILEDSQGYLWMSSNQGIYRVQKQELNDFASGKINAITSIPYGKSDGMLSVECNGGHWPAGIRARDGTLWFPTQNGVAVIDPAQVPVNRNPPPVIIESCLVERRPVPFDRPVRLSPIQTSFEIQYTAFSFANPERIRFKYKLEGLDREWTDAGSRRTAYYSHLPPGNYNFKVIAANSDGVWNTEGKQLQISVLPPFYRTWWFLSIIFLTVAGALVFAWQRRVLQFKRAQAVQHAFTRQLITSQESERKRIAAELHDSLGQRLVVIKNLALISLNGGSLISGMPDGAASSRIEEISAEASHALAEVREISYNLRPYQLDRIGLTKAIEALVKKVSRASTIAFTAEIDDIDDVFPKDSEIDFYRVVQECMNNVLKHSKATEAGVAVRRGAAELVLVVRDNGKGFTPGAAGGNPGSGGFGLIGIFERAQLLGGKPVVQSAPGQGTMISIEIPVSQHNHGK
jgi:signal transduction histidine kinase/ligand-binding sensor domain-containing protein